MIRVQIDEDELYPHYTLAEGDTRYSEPGILYKEELEFVREAMRNHKIAQRILRAAIQNAEAVDNAKD